MKKYIGYFVLFLAMTFFVVFLAMFAVAPEYSVFIFSCLALSIICFITDIILFRIQILFLMRKKSTQRVLSNLLTVFLVLCIFGMLNYLASKNDLSLDITQEKIHSLSNQSKKIIKKFRGKDIFFELYAKRSDWEKYMNLLNMYRRENSDLSINVIDVDENPALARLNNVTTNGTLILTVGKRKFRTVAKDELSVTNLLLRAHGDKIQNIYVSTGHNELSLSDQTQTGLSYLGDKILNSNIEIHKIDLTMDIPQDADAIVILNPEINFLNSELQNLKKYIENGGNLFVTLSPQFNRLINVDFLELLKSYGVEFVNGLVLDRLAPNAGGQASTPIIDSYRPHQINKDFRGRTVFPVSGLFVLHPNENFNWRPLIKTRAFPATWGELNFEEVRSGKAEYTNKVDYKGPLTLAVAGESEKGRIVLFSSSMFISNQFQGQSNNFNYFLNALEWTINAKMITSLNRPKLTGNLIYISDIHFTFVFYFAVLLFPFIFFVMAIILYRKKLSR